MALKSWPAGTFRTRPSCQVLQLWVLLTAFGWGPVGGFRFCLRFIFPHQFTARIRATRQGWGPGFRNFGLKWVTKMGQKLSPFLVQNCHNFWSKMGATLAPKWAPLWVYNGSRRTFLNIVKCARWGPHWGIFSDRFWSHFWSKIGTTLGPK